MGLIQGGMAATNGCRMPSFTYVHELGRQTSRSQLTGLNDLSNISSPLCLVLMKTSCWIGIDPWARVAPAFGPSQIANTLISVGSDVNAD